MSDRDEDKPMRPQPFTAEPTPEALIRQRQKSRSIVMALLLGAFVILMFGIAIAKIKAGLGK
jgi:hypothetical protein